jgi:hypothetical protein
MKRGMKLLLGVGITIAIPISCDSGSNSPRGAGAWECINVNAKATTPFAKARWLCVEDDGSFWFGNDPGQFAGPAPCNLFSNGNFSCSTGTLTGTWDTVGPNLAISLAQSSFQFAGTNASPCGKVLKRYRGNDVAVGTGARGGTGGTSNTGRTGGSGGSGTGGSGTGGTGGTGNPQTTFEMCVTRSCAREQSECTQTLGCSNFLSCFINCDSLTCAEACTATYSDPAQIAAFVFLQCSRDFCSNDPGPAGCKNTCLFSEDNECDDGGPESTTSACRSGTDCIDCGPR